MEDVTKQLIDFVLETGFEHLPKSTVSTIKHVLLDSLGCALAGQVVDRGRIGLEYTHETGGTPQATIIGDGKTSYAMASFVNGELINALDYDALGPMVGHVVPYVLSPCLSAAEMVSASGKDFINSLALGLEISGRVRVALGKLRMTKDTPPYWDFAPRYSYSSNVFGGVAAAAKLMKFDRTKMANAFGIAGACTPVQAGVKWEHTTGPAIMTKYNCWSGWICQLATVAALFAEKGFTGDTSIFDGEFGFGTIVGAPNFDVPALFKDLGKTWHVGTTEIKRYPTCGANHYAIAAISKLVRGHNIKPQEIKEIVVRGDPFMLTPNRTGDEVFGFQDTQFVNRYIFAIACLHGDNPGPEWQLPRYFNDRQVKELMTKINVVVHPEADRMIVNNLKAVGPTMVRNCVVEISAQGQTWTTEGTKGPSMTTQEIEAKFRHNASFSRVCTDKIDKIVEVVNKLDEIEDIHILTELMVV